MDKIIIKDLTLSYKDKKNVLKKLSLSAKSNDVISILGSSGEGKSSIFRAITLSDNIDKGEILFNDVNLITLNKKTKRKIISTFEILTQEANLIESETVFWNLFNSLKNVSFLDKFLGVLGIYRKEVKDKIEISLKKLGIIDSSHKKVSSLSGGQKQRVSCCKILINKPTLILADEPNTYLDPKTSENLMETLVKLSKDTNSILIINIHDPKLALKYSNKLIAIKNNKVLFNKKSSEVKCTDIKDIYYD